MPSVQSGLNTVLAGYAAAIGAVTSALAPVTTITGPQSASTAVSITRASSVLAFVKKRLLRLPHTRRGARRQNNYADNGHEKPSAFTSSDSAPAKSGTISGGM